MLRTKLWRLEPHTAAKHEILRRYLKRWLPIMAMSTRRFAYVDCFAGPGQYAGGEPGSPIVALDLARTYVEAKILKPKQLAVVAIEAKRSRFAHLQERCEVFYSANPPVSAIDLNLILGRYDAAISDVNRSLLRSSGDAGATFYLIDPCGVKDTPYALLPELLMPDRNEVLFNLMFEETNRFMSLPEFERPLDDMFGEPHWRSLRELSGLARKRETVDYFKSRLRQAGAKYVVVLEMRNDHNSTDYFLFFATKSLRGLEIMKRAMWEVDATGNFAFSDYTFSRGPMLISIAPDYTVLQRQIRERFAGARNVPMRDIEEFVLAETSFYKFKREALIPMKSRGECYVELTNENPSERIDDRATLTFAERPGSPLTLFS